MSIETYLAPDLLRLDFAARNKEQALDRIADIAATSPRLAATGAAAIRRLLAEREAVVSTGVGNGVAIPHARLDGLDEFVVFVLVAPDGVNFEALDGRRVNLFFVVFAPSSQVNQHLRLLAGIAKALNRSGLKRELLKTRSTSVLYEILVRSLGNEEENRYAKSRRDCRLLMVILYYDDLLNDILEFLIDVNVEGATIIRSEGMGAHISTLPLFAGFMGFMREDRKHSHTIMAIIEREDETRIVEGIEAITGDLDKMQGAMLMTLDLGYYKGTMAML